MTPDLPFCSTCGVYWIPGPVECPYCTSKAIVVDLAGQIAVLEAEVERLTPP